MAHKLERKELHVLEEILEQERENGQTLKEILKELRSQATAKSLIATIKP